MKKFILIGNYIYRRVARNDDITEDPRWVEYMGILMDQITSPEENGVDLDTQNRGVALSKSLEKSYGNHFWRAFNAWEEEMGVWG